MTVLKTKSDSGITVAMTGRLDTTTAPELEAELTDELSAVKELVFDLSGLEYVSSAGLRVFLMTQKQMNRQGSTMIVKNVAPEIKEVFDLTGFSDFLTIQ